MKTVNVPRGQVDYIEALNYEMDSTKELMMEAAARGLEDRPAYADWKQDFKDAFTKFQIAKSELEKEYAEGAVRWNLDYASGVMTIYEVNDESA